LLGEAAAVEMLEDMLAAAVALVGIEYLVLYLFQQVYLTQ
jgi:hypothetical protein